MSFEHIVQKRLDTSFNSLYSIGMNAQKELLKILQHEFSQSRARNPRYSLRAMAKSLQIAPSTLSGIFSGHIPLTAKMANRISHRLNVEPDLLQNLINDLSQKSTKLKAARKGYTELDMDHYRVISDWYYFAILSLVETQGFQSQPEWISERLGVAIPEIRLAIKRLIKLKLLKKVDDRLLTTGQQFRTTSEIASLSIRKSHIQNINLAQNSLDRDSVETRDFSAVTMAIPKNKIPLAKKRIQEFRRALCEELEVDSKEEVYRLFIAFFPLSKKTNKEIK